MKIAAIIGSRLGNNTRAVVHSAVAEMKKQYPTVEVSILDVADYELPFSDGRAFFEYEQPVKGFLESIMEADALLIGTPIFQASIPGTLKNIFDMLPVNAFEGKVASMIVTAGSPKHYLIAEQQLKPILSYMKANLVPTYVFVEEKDIVRGEIMNPDVEFRVQRLVEDTVLLVEAYQAMKEKKEATYDF